MGRTSKFSFPLPGRKARSQQVQDGKAAEIPKLSKAERLLGTSNLPVNNQPHHQSQLSHQLRKQPSSITLSVYESTIADSSDFDSDIPDVPRIPDLSFSHNQDDDVSSPFQPPFRSMSVIHNSSPRQSEDKKSHPRSHSSSTLPSIRHFKSEAELHSQAADSTYCSSDRPSASAVRNLAHTRVSGNGHGLFPVSESNTSPPRHVAYPTQSLPRTMLKQNGDKKRPTMLDLSKLFPRSSTSPASISANKDTTSPINNVSLVDSKGHTMDIKCPPQQHSPGARSSKSHKRLAKKIGTLSNSVDLLTNRPKTATSIKQKPARKRSTQPRNSKHWFDGLLEAEDDFDLDTDTDTLVTHDSSSLDPRNVSTPPGLSIRLIDHNSPSRQSQEAISFPQDNCQLRTSWQEIYAQSLHASVVVDSYAQRPSIPSPEIPIAYEDIRHNPPTPQEVASQDFPINLVVDVDEDYESDQPDVRASIALSDVDEIITIGEARAFRVNAPRHVEPVDAVEVNRPARPVPIQVSHSSNRSILSRTSDPASQTTSPARIDRTYGASDEPLTWNTRFATSSTSRPASLNSHAPSIRSIATHRFEAKPRMMAVTEEEEALLEMMRQKRAAMASHNFAEGYKTALLTSPQTPTFQNSAQSSPSSHRENISASDSSNFGSRFEMQSPGYPPSADYLAELPNFQEQRRGSEPTAYPTRPRHCKLHSASTLHSIASTKASLRDSTYQYSRRSSAEPMFIRLSTYSTSPVIVNSGLSTSPSEKSGISSMPSPVTPHTIHGVGDIPVNVMGNFARSDSSINLVEHIDGAHETPKPLPANNNFRQVRYDAHEQQTADTSLYENGDETLINETPKASVSGRESIISNNTVTDTIATCDPAHYEVGNTSYAFPQKSDQHVHHQGCCCAANVRCSVADDVIAAWGSLGGWQEMDRYRIY